MQKLLWFVRPKSINKIEIMNNQNWNSWDSRTIRCLAVELKWKVVNKMYINNVNENKMFMKMFDIVFLYVCVCVYYFFFYVPSRMEVEVALLSLCFWVEVIFLIFFFFCIETKNLCNLLGIIWIKILNERKVFRYFLGY